VSDIRRPMHDGQKPRRLQESPTNLLSPHSSHRTRRKPWARIPQRRYASISSTMNLGSGAPSLPASRSARNGRQWFCRRDREASLRDGVERSSRPHSDGRRLESRRLPMLRGTLRFIGARFPLFLPSEFRTTDGDGSSCDVRRVGSESGSPSSPPASSCLAVPAPIATAGQRQSSEAPSADRRCWPKPARESTLGASECLLSRGGHAFTAAPANPGVPPCWPSDSRHHRA
jgi:hypothetical protein